MKTEWTTGIQIKRRLSVDRSNDLRGYMEYRLEGFIGGLSKVSVLPCSFWFKNFEKFFLIYYLFSVTGCFPSTSGYLKLWRKWKEIDSFEGKKEDFGIKKYFFSVVSRVYASSPETSQAPRGTLDQGFLAQTRFPKDRAAFETYPGTWNQAKTAWRVSRVKQLQNILCDIFVAVVFAV